MVDRGQLLLALTMGAGKTVTSIAAVEQLVGEGEVDRCLVVVPSSLKWQWRNEIQKFTNSTWTIIDGPKDKRRDQWRKSGRVLYTIVNPETLINDLDLIGKFEAIVTDESSMYKNRTTKRSKMIKRLGRSIPYRFALTGQPIENRPEELFSIMEFVDKDVLGDFTTFDRTFIVRDHYGKPLRYRNLDALNKVMRECMIRKSREDIADQLPKIVHQVFPIEFDKRGAKLYNQIARELLNEITNAIKSGGKFNLWAHYNSTEGNEAQGAIMSKLTILRMLCDSPELVLKSADDYNDKATKSGSEYAAQLLQRGWLDVMPESPKIEAVLDYIHDVLDEDPKNKIVLFSFFKHNLSIIKDVTAHLTKSVLFTGDMDASQRDKAKQQFSTDPDTRLFLSSDAGGYGVDLPMANVLISLDLPWSSGKLEQREARIIRLSSQFPSVTIATFLMEGSIEERIYDMLQEKKGTNDAWIDGKSLDKDGGFTLTLDSLSNFLKASTV